MRLILATCFTLSLAWLWDRSLYFFGLMLGIHERQRVILFVPVGEEVFKYGVSYLSLLSPPLLCFSFGLGEGLYESLHIRRKLNPLVIFVGIFSHTVFSIFYIFRIPVWLSLFLAIISHSIWNNLIFNFKNDCKRSTD